MREMRSLSFTDREVITAVVDLMRKRRQPLPSGQIVGIELMSEPVRAQLTVEDNFGARATIQRNATELAASMVNYCLERRIRLPSNGRKFVELIAGSLNLIIYMDGSPAAKGTGRLLRPSTAVRA